uniref:Uncharacterized protein n=1 Tax=Arundo donax TaxID=35708 RepID=A0A0A9E0C5_ARUDO
MPSSIQIIKTIQNHIKLLEEINTECTILHICMVWCYIDIWPKFQNSLPSNFSF